MEYRGIKLDDSVKLYKKDGSYNKPVKSGLDQFTDRANDLGHKVVGIFKGSLKKLEIDFNCGHKPHPITPNNYKRGYGCPYCSESKGEKIIREWLESEKIPFKTQYIFPSQTKKYDFCLPNDNLIIEVHGRQHYGESFFHINPNKRGRKTLQEEQENDRLKEEYARSQGYSYIVVDYREHKPKLALERFKKQYKEFKERK